MKTKYENLSQSFLDEEESWKTAVEFEEVRPSILRPMAAVPPKRRCWCCSATKEGAAGFHYRGGTRLRVYRYGTRGGKNAVVLLHGLLASHRTWEDVCEVLTALGYVCYAPDLLGFGESPWPMGEASFSLESHVSRIVRDVLVDAVVRDGASRVHLIGHSLGAVLATEIAARGGLPVKIASLTTFALPYFASREQARASLQDWPTAYKSWRGAAIWLVLTHPNLSYALCSVICQQRWFYARVASMLDGCAGHRKRSFSTRFADALNHSYDSVVASYRQCIEGHRLVPRRLDSDIPVLIAHGRQDDVVDPSLSDALYRDLCATRRKAPTCLVFLDGVKHSCHDAVPSLGLLIRKWLVAVDDGEAPASVFDNLGRDLTLPVAARPRSGCCSRFFSCARTKSKSPRFDGELGDDLVPTSPNDRDAAQLLTPPRADRYRLQPMATSSAMIV